MSRSLHRQTFFSFCFSISSFLLFIDSVSEHRLYHLSRSLYSSHPFFAYRFSTFVFVPLLFVRLFLHCCQRRIHGHVVISTYTFSARHCRPVNSRLNRGRDDRSIFMVFQNSLCLVSSRKLNRLCWLVDMTFLPSYSPSYLFHLIYFYWSPWILRLYIYIIYFIFYNENYYFYIGQKLNNNEKKLMQREIIYSLNNKSFKFSSNLWKIINLLTNLINIEWFLYGAFIEIRLIIFSSSYWNLTYGFA